MELIAGRTVGRLTLIGRDPDKKRNWICECSCPNSKKISIRDQSLKDGKTRSCGCLKLELLSARKTHGMSDSPTYRAWTSMWNRVRNHPEYVGKGRRVCARWEKFENFLGDMGEKPEGNRISVERIDNDSDYSPSNCVWAGPLTQNRNKRDTIRMHIRSERFDASKHPAEWAGILLSHTGNTVWTPRYLQSVLRAFPLDEILQTAGVTSLSAQSADVEEDFLVAA